MALGQKLGKVFGAVGSGLSFVPGPWSALGIALSAGGQIASGVGKAKDRREAAAERDENMAPTNVQPAETVADRPDQTQLPDVPQMQLQPPGRNVFQPSMAPQVGGRDDLMDQAVVQQILREGGLYGQR